MFNAFTDNFCNSIRSSRATFYRHAFLHFLSIYFSIIIIHELKLIIDVYYSRYRFHVNFISTKKIYIKFILCNIDNEKKVCIYAFLRTIT